MFRVKDFQTGQIFTVLSVARQEPYYNTVFLIWEDYKWKWERADRFIPPNLDIKEFLENEKPF